MEEGQEEEERYFVEGKLFCVVLLQSYSY